LALFFWFNPADFSAYGLAGSLLFNEDHQDLALRCQTGLLNVCLFV
jgi:hypothetical protein